MNGIAGRRSPTFPITAPRMTGIGVRRERRRFPAGASPARQMLQPDVQRQFSWPVGVNCGVRLRFSFPA